MDNTKKGNTISLSYWLSLPELRLGYSHFWKGEPFAEFGDYWLARAYEEGRQLAAELAAIEPDAPHEITFAKRAPREWHARYLRCTAAVQLARYEWARHKRK